MLEFQKKELHMNITIEKLTENSLAQAENLRDKIFGKTTKTEALTLKASLNPKEYKNVYEDNYIKDMEYWIAKSNNEVIGIIGLYTENNEDNKTCWLGWFAVEPKFRGFKIGKKLLDFAVNKAKERGYEYLKLYTYDSDEFKIAQELYKKEGFEEFNRKNKELYFIKKLNKGTKMKETHPFKPYIPENATKLIIGTIPPPRFAKNELFNEDVNFYYGSKDNNFWDIIEKIANINFKKENTQEEIEKRKKFLDDNKIGICDIVYKTNRKNENSAADEDLIDIEPLDIINEILVKYPTIDTLIYTSKFVKTQMTQLLKKLYEKEICHISSEDKDKKTLTINDKIYNVAILYSPSNNANRRISNEQRIEQYKKYLGGH
jgi:ribosomal protein S18 acetylase RimI-like enzyme/G:T/U-mismatch repair DNA glycosylase